MFDLCPPCTLLHPTAMRNSVIKAAVNEARPTVQRWTMNHDRTRRSLIVWSRLTLVKFLRFERFRAELQRNQGRTAHPVTETPNIRNYKRAMLNGTKEPMP